MLYNTANVFEKNDDIHNNIRLTSLKMAWTTSFVFIYNLIKPKEITIIVPPL